MASFHCLNLNVLTKECYRNIRLFSNFALKQFRTVIQKFMRRICLRRPSWLLIDFTYSWVDMHWSMAVAPRYRFFERHFFRTPGKGGCWLCLFTHQSPVIQFLTSHRLELVRGPEIGDSSVLYNHIKTTMCKSYSVTFFLHYHILTLISTAYFLLRFSNWISKM